MSIRVVIALSLLGIVISAPCVAQSRTVADYMAAIEGAQASAGPNRLGEMAIEQLMEDRGVPGVSIAVIRDFKVHWAKGYGVADVETGAKVDTETMFQAASISKPVSAMAVLRAVQDGLFKLDGDINDILTSWKLNGGEFTRHQPVTPRSLMSHTSGLGDAFGFPGYDPSDPLPTVVQILGGHKLSNVGPVLMERAPMTFYEYSGGGIIVMQQALCDATGRAFADIMRDSVLRPIGMVNSTYEQPLGSQRNRNAARAHDWAGRSQGAKWHVYPELAAASLWTTPTDLARFAIEVQKSALGKSNRVLSRTTVQEMLSPVGVGPFAVGFEVFREGEGWYFNHDGGNWGFRCTLIAHKVKGYGLAIMTNAELGYEVHGELSRRIKAVYEWDSTAPPVRRGYGPLSEEDRKKAVLQKHLQKRRLLERLRDGEPIRINCGGEELTTADGRRWSKDVFFTRGFTPRKNFVDIQDTEDDRIYWSERYTKQPESVEYLVPVPSGRYRVVLHFAEVWLKEPGKRRFHVALEGKKVMTEYEPKINKAEVFKFETLVEDGQLDISFIHGSLDNPKINAIEIEPLTADSSDAPKAVLLHLPEGWSAEEGKYPPAWAPSLKWTGELKLRFSPGMFRENDPEFWSYVILYSLDGDVMKKTKELTHALRVYDAGLYGKKWPAEKIDIRVDKHWKTQNGGNDISRWAVTYDGFDPFVTNKPLTTQMEIWRSYSPKQDRTGVLILRSPLSPSSSGPVWKSLRTFEKDFNAQFVLLKENRSKNGAPGESRSGGGKK